MGNSFIFLQISLPQAKSAHQPHCRSRAPAPSRWHPLLIGVNSRDGVQSDLEKIEGKAMFEKIMVAGWGDMDFNSHMRNTAYLDKSADLRMMYFADHGFPMAEFMRLKIGPVVKKDEVEYFREFQLLDPVRVTMMLAGLSEDGNRMKLRNDFYRDDVLAARVTSTAGWLDLSQRKLVCPPAALLRALRDADRSEDFQVMPDIKRV
jgi:acyl-CoA thioester hydrolase